MGLQIPIVLHPECRGRRLYLASQATGGVPQARAQKEANSGRASYPTTVFTDDPIPLENSFRRWVSHQGKSAIHLALVYGTGRKLRGQHVWARASSSTRWDGTKQPGLHPNQRMSIREWTTRSLAFTPSFEGAGHDPFPPPAPQSKAPRSSGDTYP